MRNGQTTISALNIQSPWGTRIATGAKTIETRHYPLPLKHVGRPLLLVETPGRQKQIVSRVVGLVVFGESFQYRSRTQFVRDGGRHLVPTNHPDFGWSEEPKWGWPVLQAAEYESGLPPDLRRGIVFTSSVSLSFFPKRIHTIIHGFTETPTTSAAFRHLRELREI